VTKAPSPILYAPGCICSLTVQAPSHLWIQSAFFVSAQLQPDVTLQEPNDKQAFTEIQHPCITYTYISILWDWPAAGTLLPSTTGQLAFRQACSHAVRGAYWSGRRWLNSFKERTERNKQIKHQDRNVEQHYNKYLTSIFSDGEGVLVQIEMTRFFLSSRLLLQLTCYRGCWSWWCLRRSVLFCGQRRFISLYCSNNSSQAVDGNCALPTAFPKHICLRYHHCHWSPVPCSHWSVFQLLLPVFLRVWIWAQNALHAVPKNVWGKVVFRQRIRISTWTFFQRVHLLSGVTLTESWRGSGPVGFILTPIETWFPLYYKLYGI